MKAEMKLQGLDGVLDTLRQLPAEVVSKRGGPARAALRKGAVVIHKQELANLRAVLGHQKDGVARESTGLLLKNVVVTRGKEPKDTKGERYLVRVRRKVYPGRSGKSAGQKATTTLAAAQLLEYGSSQQPAEPWIRPAFESRAREAIATVETEMLKGIDRITKKLAKQNARK
jgi:HK97 gp10 family phage protein